MPSIYLKHAYMPDSFQVVMPFGTFSVGLTQAESDPERFADDSIVFSYAGQHITRGQYRLILAERDRLAADVRVRVQAANAARDAAIAERLESASRAQQDRLVKARRKLEDKIAWADGELARITAIKLRAQRDLGELSL